MTSWTTPDRKWKSLTLGTLWPAKLPLRRQDRGFCDPESLRSGTSSIDYDKPDSTEFRTSWKYMPQFKILDETELVKTMAVFLMLFIFIAIVCFAAVIVISFTRCMTIGMTNARVYDDLRHLGRRGRTYTAR